MKWCVCGFILFEVIIVFVLLGLVLILLLGSLFGGVK